MDLETKVLDRLLKVGFDYASGPVSRASNQLFEAMHIVKVPPQGGYLYIPQYFARFVHDGTPAVRRPLGTVPYVWFPDPKDDPRLNSGRTPHRVSQLSDLTLKRAVFKSKLESGELVVARSRPEVEAKLFFDNNVGMAGFCERANSEVGQFTQSLLTKELGDSLFTESGINVNLSI